MTVSATVSNSSQALPRLFIELRTPPLPARSAAKFFSVHPPYFGFNVEGASAQETSLVNIRAGGGCSLGGPHVRAAAKLAVAAVAVPRVLAGLRGGRESHVVWLDINQFEAPSAKKSL